MNERRDPDSGWSWWYLLFLIQLAVVIWPAFYNKIERISLGTIERALEHPWNKILSLRGDF